MHGLINKAIQSYLGNTFGPAMWDDVSRHARLDQSLGPDGFEAMQTYDNQLTEAVLASAARLTNRPRAALLEDLGTYLVSHPTQLRLRRLLRFGGISFTDFLHSLEDLPGRTRLAVPEMTLPEFVTHETAPGRFHLTFRNCPPGFGYVMLGALRALADDYGALTVAEHQDATAPGGHEQDVPTDADSDHESLLIEVHDPAFHAGRRFDLADMASA